MTTTTTTTDEIVTENVYDEEIWKQAQTDNAPFIKLEIDVPKIVRFTTNDPYEIVPNDYGQDEWRFVVLDAAGREKEFDVASLILKRALFGAMPLVTADVVITRSGEGYDTTYEVVRVE